MSQDSDSPILVPLSTILDLFDIGSSRVTQLAEKGVIVREYHGRYDLLKSVKGYVGYLKARPDNQYDDDTEPEDGGHSANEARRLNVIKKNELLDLQISEKKGNLINRANVHEQGIRAGAILSAECNAMLNDMPGQLAGSDEVGVREKLGARLDSLQMQFKEACSKAADPLFA